MVSWDDDPVCCVRLPPPSACEAIATLPRMHGPRRSGSLALVAALTAAAILAGCGGGDSTTTTGLSKAEFLAKGDAICRQGKADSAKLQPSPPITPQKAATLQKGLIHIAEMELDELRALGAPSELQPALDRYLRAREQGIALLNKGLDAAENNDPVAYAKAKATLNSDQVQRLKLAQSVGFSDCSRPGA
jgi:hypothetical protein